MPRAPRVASERDWSEGFLCSLSEAESGTEVSFQQFAKLSTRYSQPLGFILKFPVVTLLSPAMDGETFRSRLLTLLQRSRQAHRLYSSMERGQRGDAAELSEMQASAWREVNAELVQHLSSMLDAPHTRHLLSNVRRLRDRFFADLREVESQLNEQHRELVRCAERGDFIRTAVLSRTLVSSKARAQANNAAFTELEEALRGVGAVKEESDADQNASMPRPEPSPSVSVSLHATPIHAAIATSLRSLGDRPASALNVQPTGAQTEGRTFAAHRTDGPHSSVPSSQLDAADGRSPINRKVVRERFVGEGKVIPLRRRSL